MRTRSLLAAFALSSAITLSLSAGVAPVIDTFVVTPAVPAPGQAVTITLTAHDPDCATSCTTGCGLTIRGDMVYWSDNTGRTPSPFSSQSQDTLQSPFTATVTWVAPPAEGTYNVSIQLNDSGGMLCGGRKTTNATYPVTVTNSQPPLIDSFTASPQSVAVGGSVDLTVLAHDPASKPLTYAFTADAGTIAQSSNASSVARWTAPQVAGNVTIRGTVSNGATAVSSQVMVTVQIGAFTRVLSLPDIRTTRMLPMADGTFVLADGSSGTLTNVTSTGAVLWRSRGLATPVAVVQSGGQLFVLERGARAVSVWSTGGAKLRQFAVPGSSASSIAAGPGAGEISITDTASARVIVASTADGSVLRTLGGGVLQAPTGIATSNGRIAVADAALGQVVVFDANGSVTRTLGDSTLLVRPQGLAWDVANARLVVADSFSGELTILGEEGTVRGSLSGWGTSAGQIINPIDVALLPNGSIGVTTAGGDISFFQMYASLAPVAAPTGVTASDRANDEGGAVQVSWVASADDPARVTSYVVERAQEETGDFRTITTVARGTPSYVDTSTVDGTCYHYRVVATDGVNRSPSAQTACASSHNDVPPPPPAAVVAIAESPTQVRITWTGVVVADLAGYSIEIGTTELGFSTIRVAAAVNDYIATGLAASTAYQVNVRAIDSGSNASAAVTTFVTTPSAQPPAAPDSVTVSDPKLGGTLDITWRQDDAFVTASKVVLTPREPGWPVVQRTATGTSLRVDGLVNRLTYEVTVASTHAWGGESEPSPPVEGVATAKPRVLPVLDATSIADTAGLAIEFSIATSDREIRFQYSSERASVQAFIDGRPAGPVLEETNGAWRDASITLDADQVSARDVHTLELRNLQFPDATARVSVRRGDFVPLPPRAVSAQGHNTVVDVSWEPQETRSDLGVVVLRARKLKRRETFAPIECGDAATALCRDAFFDNDDAADYRVAIASPAGWLSEMVEVSGAPHYEDGPPPVTDARTSTRDHRLLLDWTPVSTAAAPDALPQPVPLYRIYRVSGDRLSFAGETAAPPFAIEDGADFVVHSVDAQARESK